MNNSKYPFINRELSWLDFNERVLEIVKKDKVPLMEKLKFISIFSNNLDEFFMIRVAGIVDQIDLGYEQKDRAGLSPKEVLERIRSKTKKLLKKQKSCFFEVVEELSKKGINIGCGCSKNESEYCSIVFEDVILPTISPITLSSANPFPFIYNKRSAFIVEMEKDNRDFISVIIIPEKIKKIYTNKTNGKTNVFVLEKIIADKLQDMFKDYSIKDYYIIRITRNADLSIAEEESEDLLKLVEQKLDKRRKGQVVRLEINKEPSRKIEKLLLKHFDIEKDDIYITSDYIDLTSFFEFKVDDKSLYFEVLSKYLPKDIPLGEGIFDYLKEKEILLYRPYNDFSLISRLVETASNDENTLSIKMTLYRTNKNSTIVQNLIKAAQNGKSVSVVIELKARFDEKMNVEWAKKLEKAGCIVTYGIPGLKIHSKNLLITRNEAGKIIKYSHLSTGNYNEDTANVYTDLDYITSNEDIGADNANLFNYLMGYTDYAKWHNIVLAPRYLRKRIIELIDYEIESAKKGQKAHIIIKVNSLIDKDLIKKLYEASKNGVLIDLIVRGMCSLKPKIDGISNNIRVVSIVGRFLEHPRVFYFYHDGCRLTFISSADFMERNMDRRVEHMIEIKNPTLKEKLINMLNLNLKDNVNAWELQGCEYVKTEPENKLVDSQDYYIKNEF